MNRRSNVLCAAIAWSCIAACLGVSACTHPPRDGGKMVLHAAISEDVKTLDPANAYDEVSLTVLPQIVETLYQYAYLADPYRIEPLLALDLPTLSKDRLTVTIRIRTDVRYQDDPCFRATQGVGRAITAQDFVYGLKRLALPSIQSTGWWILDGKIQGINRFHDRLVAAQKEDQRKIFDESVDGIQALDDQTLRLKLTKPYPQLLYILSMSFTAPVPPEMVQAYGDTSGNVTMHPVGTGPFRLKEWTRNSRIKLDRNPTYAPNFYPSTASEVFKQQGLLADAGSKLPILDGIDFEIIKESQPAWLKFMNGELDLLGIPKDNFSSAIDPVTHVLKSQLKDKGMKLYVSPSLTYYNIAVNMKVKLLGSNRLLRQAISSAVNRERWIDLFTNGRGLKQTTALPFGILDRPENTRIKYDLDLARARDLLKKAGYREGKGLPTIKFDMRGADSTSRQLGEFFEQQLAQVGIKLEVVYNSFPAFLEKQKQGALQLSLGGWTMDYPDAENVYQLLYGPNCPPGPNDSCFDDPEMNALYLKIAGLESGPLRAKLIAQMDELLQEQVPWALGYYVVDYRLSQSGVRGYRAADVIQNKFKYLRIARSRAEP